MKTLINRTLQNLAGYTPGEQPRIPGLVKLNTNENPYPPSPRVARALRIFSAANLRRYPDPDSLRLRTRLAQIHRCRPEQVFIGNGSDEILALCTRAFVDDNGSIGYFQPSYSLYPVLARIRNVRALPVDLTTDFEWRMPARFSCSLFFLANPNAPTGMLFPVSQVRVFCRRLSGVVAIDEAYADFAPANCLSLARTLSNVLVIRTLSKSFSLAGLRVGYAIGPVSLIAALCKLKDSYNVSRLAQSLAWAALADLPYMRRNVARVIAMRKKLVQALQKRGFRVYPSAANFLWTRPPAMPAAEWYRSLRARAVLVRHFSGKTTEDFLRITIGKETEMHSLLRALDGILRTATTAGE